MKEAAIGIVTTENNAKVLIVKRVDLPVWVLPGGGIEPEENAEDTVIREIKEETGLDVIITRKVAEYSPVNKMSSVTHTFQCTEVGGALSLSPETCDVGYYPVNALPKRFFPPHHDLINDTLRHHPAVIRRSLTSTSYFRGLLYLLRHPLISIRYFARRLKKED